jgi:hypothetical protein
MEYHTETIRKLMACYSIEVGVVRCSYHFEVDIGKQAIDTA